MPHIQWWTQQIPWMLENLHPKSASRHPLLLDMWLHHLLNISMKKVYHTHSTNNTKALICSPTWWASVRSKINECCYVAGVCMFLQKEKKKKSSQFLLSPIQNFSCTMVVKEGQGNNTDTRRWYPCVVPISSSDYWREGGDERVWWSCIWVTDLLPIISPLSHTVLINGWEAIGPWPAVGRIVLKEERKKW